MACTEYMASMSLRCYLLNQNLRIIERLVKPTFSREANDCSGLRPPQILVQATRDT